MRALPSPTLRFALVPLLLAALAGAAGAQPLLTTTVPSRVESPVDLRELLRAGATPAGLTPITLDQTCGGADGCRVDVGRLTVLTDQGRLVRAGGVALRLMAHQPADAPPAPDLDWTPTAAYEVYTGARRFGTCLEFSNAPADAGRGGAVSLGDAPRGPRWRSLVIVPFRAGQPLDEAHRFVGYWGGCDALLEGSTPDEVVLPIIEPGRGGHGLRLMRQRCDADGCSGREDGRRVVVDPQDRGAIGALLISP